jgi:ATP-binding cassette subfamily C (CFTR/MRP) protein 1
VRKVLDTRNNQEMKMLRKIGIVTVRSAVLFWFSLLNLLPQACNTALWNGIPLLVAFSSFATAAVTSSRPLTSDIIFPAIALFMLLQFPLAMVREMRITVA